MRQLARHSNKRRFFRNARHEGGFTLIEVMVTLIILAFGMLASIFGIMAASDHAFMNELRNDAMKLAQEEMDVVRNTPYSTIGNTVQTVNRQVRKATVPYTVTLTQKAVLYNTVPASEATALPANGMQLVQVEVDWTHKSPGKNPRTFSYTAQTIVRQTQ